MKVLHCPTNVGSHPAMLAWAERRLGLESRCLSFHPSSFVSGEDTSIALRGGPLRKELTRLGAFLGNLGHDVYHFNFGRSFFLYPPALSFLDAWDLPLLRALGKRIVVTYQGCDARQRGKAAARFTTCACGQPACGLPRCDAAWNRQKAELIGRFERHADHIFSLNPDLMHDLPARTEFMPYASVDLDDWTRLPPQPGRVITVLHAPSDALTKGSERIEAALERVLRGRADVRYLRVRGVPRAELRGLLGEADLVVDQALIGWYGGLAVEAMALGKAVACYLREDDLGFIPPDMRRELPVLRLEPDDMAASLAAMLHSREALLAAGERGRAFVRRWHDPARLAARARETYQR